MARILSSASPPSSIRSPPTTLAVSVMSARLMGRSEITQTSSGDALGGRYSPDGARIAFVASSLLQPHVYVQELNGSAPQIISRYVFGEKGYAKVTVGVGRGRKTQDKRQNLKDKEAKREMRDA